MKLNKRCITIGLTGCIGSGKSTVTSYLRENGYRVVDADQVAKDLVAQGQPGYIQILEAFGSAIVLENGEIDRKKLGSIVFNQKSKRELLNAILHPLIRRTIRDQVDSYCQEDSLVFADVPLLIESDMMDAYDHVWLVYAPESICLQRTMLRDSLSFEEALARVHSQKPIEEKRKYADVILDNSKDLSYLYNQINENLSKLLLVDS